MSKLRNSIGHGNWSFQETGDSRVAGGVMCLLHYVDTLDTVDSQ